MLSSWQKAVYFLGDPVGQPRGQRKYACDKKGRGTRGKGDFGDYIERGK